MIIGILHSGSGLGNQLHRYVATRIIAADYSVPFSMVAPENFKGNSFMKIDMGEGNHLAYHTNDLSGEVIIETEAMGKEYAIIDGDFQNEDVWKHRENEVRKWLKVEPLEMPDNLCVIGFRGGEYVGVKDLFLPQGYWDEAISMMKEKYPDITFQVHTDDVETAQKFFPDFSCIHEIGFNWRSVRYAKHLIIANSSFFILPAILNEDVKEVIAPKYWAGHNKGVWQKVDNIYDKFTYI